LHESPRILDLFSIFTFAGKCVAELPIPLLLLTCVNKLSKQLYVKSQQGRKKKRGGGSKGSRSFFGRFYPPNTEILVEKLNHKNLLSCQAPPSPLSLISGPSNAIFTPGHSFFFIKFPLRIHSGGIRFKSLFEKETGRYWQNNEFLIFSKYCM
jgi:hypothetical protein